MAQATKRWGGLAAMGTITVGLITEALDPKGAIVAGVDFKKNIEMRRARVLLD